MNAWNFDTWNVQYEINLYLVRILNLEKYLKNMKSAILTITE